jgi:hypothetical protein
MMSRSRKPSAHGRQRHLALAAEKLHGHRDAAVAVLAADVDLDHVAEAGAVLFSVEVTVAKRTRAGHVAQVVGLKQQFFSFRYCLRPRRAGQRGDADQHGVHDTPAETRPSGRPRER